MADYTVRVVANTEEAEKKVDKLDKKVVQVTEDRKLNISFPSLNDIIENFKTLGRAIKTTWEIAGKTPLLGGRINDLQEVLEGAVSAVDKLKTGIIGLTKLTPQNILQGAFSGLTRGVDEASRRVANLGFTIFGVTQSINILKGAFGQFFNDTIGREIRLQESLLRTKTTLASTADVAVNGRKISDPYEAILKLEGPVNETIENIRRRSLDIAGTTSDAIIQVFGVVASQIGNIGGGFKEAEDLAITFSAALGTLGLSDPMYATQEIRSILTGTIDQNSVLARSLGLTNEEVSKAKNSAEGLVEFLKRRLSAFTSGQQLAAKGFAGITSNIEEFTQEVKRSLGKGMLAPLLEGLTVLYERLQLVFKSSLGIADALGRSFGAIGKGVVGAAAAAPLLQGFSQRKQTSTFNEGEKYAVDLFVKVQQYIDNLRPAIANLVNQIVAATAQLASGLKVLVEGFVQFKAESLKVYISAFINLANILNSTVVPAFTALMKLYGDILKMPLAQWINAAAIDFGLLERIGVMPTVRVLFSFSKAIGGAMSLLKQASGVIQTVIRSIAGAIDYIIVGISKLVAFISSSLVSIGQGLIWASTTGVQAVIAALRLLTVKIGETIVSFAVMAQAAGPQFAQIAVALANIGQAFIRLDVSLERTGVKFQELSVEAQAALNSIRVTAAGVQSNINTLGSNIKSGLENVGKGAAGMVGGFIKSIGIFFIQMAAVQLLVLGIYELFTKFNKQQQNIADKTRAELAVKRLSTVYAELGENASAAAKAMRDLERSILSNRISDVTKSYGELTEKIRDIQEMGADKNAFTQTMKQVAAIMNFSNFDVKPQNGETFADALLRARRAQAAELRKELENLTKAQERTDASNKATEDVQLLAKERLALEAELKELRKNINKELSDLEWSEKQKVLGLEQQMKEALFAKERTEMERRHQQENQNLGSIGQGFASILDEYQKGVFDAQVESEKRQFDMATRRAELEKQVDDYRYRLEEQTLKLRAKMGEMNKKVVDYESAERIRVSREVLAYALKAAAVQGEDFVVTPDEKTAFLNAAAQQGVSAERALALLKTGAGRDLGLSSASAPDQIISALKENFGPAFALSPAKFEKALNQRAKDFIGQSKGGTFALQTAREELGTGRWLKTSPTPPPKMEDLSSFLNVDRETSRMRSALETTFRKNQEFMRVMNQLDFARPMEEFKQRINDPNLWRVQNIGELDEQIRQLAANTELTNKSLAQGQLPTQLEQLRSNLNMMLDVMLDTYASKELQQIRNDKTLKDSAKQQYEKAIQSLVTSARQFDATTMMQAAAGWPAQVREAPQVARLLEVLKSYKKFTDQLPAVAQQMNALTIEQVKNNISEARRAAADLRPAITESFTEFTELLQSLIPGGYSLDKANLRSGLNAQQFVTGQLLSLPPDVLSDPTKVQGVFTEGEKLRAQYEATNAALHPMREALETFKTRLDLAASSTEIFLSAHRSFAEELLGGAQDLGSAVQNFGETISRGFVSKFLDYALRPMQDQMFSLFKGVFGVQDAEEAARAAIITSQENLARALGANTIAIDANTRSKGATPELGGQGGTGPASTTKIPVISYSRNAETYQQAMGAATAALNAQATGAKQTVPKAFTFGTALQGATQAIAGIAMGIAGAQQMSKGGGTYGTLMGLAGIFGALGSITGMFGTGGIFAGSGAGGGANLAQGIDVPLGQMPIGMRAAGGPVSARRPYIVGEIGPELFVPEGNGTIIPNDKIAFTGRSGAGSNTEGGSVANAFSTLYGASIPFTKSTERVLAERSERETVSAINNPKPIDVRYESQIINQTEYVTAEQHQRGMAQAAERGRALTLEALQNSVTSRRKIGIN